MIPPLNSYGTLPDPSAPLGRSETVMSADTAEQCQEVAFGLRKQIRDRIKRESAEYQKSHPRTSPKLQDKQQEVQIEEQSLEVVVNEVPGANAACVATDDPRLKEK
jgi:hypothetical protein